MTAATLTKPRSGARAQLRQRHRDLVEYLSSPREEWQRATAINELDFVLRALREARK